MDVLISMQIGDCDIEQEDTMAVPSINSSALKYLNLSAKPGTLASHDYLASIGYKNPSLDLQDSTATHP